MIIGGDGVRGAVVAGDGRKRSWIVEMPLDGVDVAEIGRGVVWFDAENRVRALRLIANFRAPTIQTQQQNNIYNHSWNIYGKRIFKRQLSV